MKTATRFSDSTDHELKVKRSHVRRVLENGPRAGMTAEMVAQRMLQPIDHVTVWLNELAIMGDAVRIEQGLAPARFVAADLGEPLPSVSAQGDGADVAFGGDA